MNALAVTSIDTSLAVLEQELHAILSRAKAEMLAAAEVERNACLAIALEMLYRASKITDREFADGCSFAAQEIAAAISARAKSTTSVETTREQTCPKTPSLQR